jgi:hypothetical protein
MPKAPLVNVHNLRPIVDWFDLLAALHEPMAKVILYIPRILAPTYDGVIVRSAELRVPQMAFAVSGLR